MFMQIYALNPKLKETVLNKLLKNIMEIVKRLDDSIHFLNAEIKVCENRVFSDMLNKDAQFFAYLFKSQINVLNFLH